MKLADIIVSIRESLNPETAYEFTKVSQSLWKITTDNGEIDVNIETKVVDGLTCSLVKFNDASNTGQPHLTNKFGAHATRVFASIIQILRSIQADVLLFVPSDANASDSERKRKLYRNIANRLVASGKANRVEEFSDLPSSTTVQVCIPKPSKATLLSNDQLELLVTEFLSN